MAKIAQTKAEVARLKKENALLKAEVKRLAVALAAKEKK